MPNWSLGVLNFIAAVNAQQYGQLNATTNIFAYGGMGKMQNTEMSKRIKKAVEETGLMKKEIAYLVGVNQVTLSKYMSGAIEPSKDILAKIAEVCGVTVEWLTCANEEVLW